MLRCPTRGLSNLEQELHASTHHQQTHKTKNESSNTKYVVPEGCSAMLSDSGSRCKPMSNPTSGLLCRLAQDKRNMLDASPGVMILLWCRNSQRILLAGWLVLEKWTASKSSHNPTKGDVRTATHEASLCRSSKANAPSTALPTVIRAFSYKTPSRTAEFWSCIGKALKPKAAVSVKFRVVFVGTNQTTLVWAGSSAAFSDRRFSGQIILHTARGARAGPQRSFLDVFSGPDESSLPLICPRSCRRISHNYASDEGAVFSAAMTSRSSRRGPMAVDVEMEGANATSAIASPTDPSNTVLQEDVEKTKVQCDTGLNVDADQPNLSDLPFDGTLQDRSQPSPPLTSNPVADSSGQQEGKSPKIKVPPLGFQPGSHGMGAYYQANPWTFNQTAAADLLEQPFPQPMTVKPDSLHHSNSGPGNHASSGNAPETRGLESFATLDFPDSIFEMTTYEVVIGRDQIALEVAKRNEKQAALEEKRHQMLVEKHKNEGLPPPEMSSFKVSRFSKSYVSEEGGILGPEESLSDNEMQMHKSKRRKGSSAGSARNDAGPEEISDRQYVSHTPGAVPVDIEALRTSPYHVTMLPIHSPGPAISTNTKAISRRHMRIKYNLDTNCFEAYALHRNGFFINEQHYNQIDVPVVLRCGDVLQIKDVVFTFKIPGVPHGCTGAEPVQPATYSEGGKEMSFAFEGTHQARESSSEELSSPPAMDQSGEDDADSDRSDEESADSDDEEDDGNRDGQEDEMEESREREADDGDEEMMEVEPKPEPQPETKIKAEPTIEAPVPDVPMPPKKRGPGRPPKNGIMSQREQRELEKKARLAQKTLPKEPAADPPVKRGVGRPRKHPLPEGEEEKREKRKYAQRKPKNAEGGDGSGAPAEGAPKKEKKRPRSKSPDLVLREEDYTEQERNARPDKNYFMLLNEVFDKFPEGNLKLKQVYKQLMILYPFFYFQKNQKGWESSVRHNLIGSSIFKKDPETGRWSRVPGEPSEPSRKRKTRDEMPNGAPYAGQPVDPAAAQQQQQTYREQGQLPPQIRAQQLQHAASQQPGDASYLQQHTNQLPATSAMASSSAIQTQASRPAANGQPPLAAQAVGGPGLMPAAPANGMPRAVTTPAANAAMLAAANTSAGRPTAMNMQSLGTPVQGQPHAQPQYRATQAPRQHHAQQQHSGRQPQYARTAQKLVRKTMFPSEEIKTKLLSFKAEATTKLRETGMTPERAEAIVLCALNAAVGVKVAPLAEPYPRLGALAAAVPIAVLSSNAPPDASGSGSGGNSTPPVATVPPTTLVDPGLVSMLNGYRDATIPMLPQLKDILESIVDSAINHVLWQADHPAVVEERFYKVFVARLKNLIERWEAGEEIYFS